MNKQTKAKIWFVVRFWFLLLIWYWLYNIYETPQWPKILMLCSAPWEWCVPYTEPQPIKIERQSYLTWQ